MADNALIFQSSKHVTTMLHDPRFELTKECSELKKLVEDVESIIAACPTAGLNKENHLENNTSYVVVAKALDGVGKTWLTH